MKYLLSILLLTSLISCSSSKPSESNDSEVELADSMEFEEDGGEDAVDEFVEDEAFEDEVAQTDEPVSEELAADESAPITIDESQGTESLYTVKANETLMLIAFKIYGDYGKWKSIAQWNADKLSANYNITEGMQLKYMAPSEEFVWNPDGNPYLIKSGDTLGTISQETYGRYKFWKDIWKNNDVLIKDPNKIFAGFTIYTPIIESRDVANI